MSCWVPVEQMAKKWEQARRLQNLVEVLEQEHMPDGFQTSIYLYIYISIYANVCYVFVFLSQWWYQIGSQPVGCKLKTAYRSAH